MPPIVFQPTWVRHNGTWVGTQAYIRRGSNWVPVEVWLRSAGKWVKASNEIPF